MTNDERMANDEFGIHKFVIPSSLDIRHLSFRLRGAFTLIELMLVIAIIIILAGLVLATVKYVQEKGARSRAEAEIAAMSAALESYKADNGIYAQSAATNALNAKVDVNPTATTYQNASLYLFGELSGLSANQQPVAGKKSYFNFKPQMLGHIPSTSSAVAFIRDPWGNSYGYSTAYQLDPTKGYNPTYDLWSTGPMTSPTPTPPAGWIKNW